MTDVLSSEEEEGEEGAAAGEGQEGGEGGDGEGEGPVKKEPGAKKSRARTPSHELHSYSEQELGTFKKRELLADAELLDGAFPPQLRRILDPLTPLKRRSRTRSLI